MWLLFNYHHLPFFICPYSDCKFQENGDQCFVHYQSPQVLGLEKVLKVI